MCHDYMYSNISAVSANFTHNLDLLPWKNLRERRQILNLSELVKTYGFLMISRGIEVDWFA